jgi:hypothetical protein
MTFGDSVIIGDSGIVDMDWNLWVVSVLIGDQKCLSSSVRRLKYIGVHGLHETKCDKITKVWN